MHGRKLGLVAVSVLLCASPSGAQTAGKAAPGRAAVSKPKAKAATAAAPKGDEPVMTPRAIPVNPNDAIATVNGEVITRAQLANECIAMKGEDVLEVMIGRKLVDQAIRAKKVTVTQAEIDAEIDRVAETVAHMTRENWLRTLAKEKKINPTQYEKDIIYPGLAVRKLAIGRVQVTETDLKEAFESQFGEKLKAKIIMVGSIEHGKQLWEELRKNPGGFERLAQYDGRSIDTATRAAGGKMDGPIARHAEPRTVSDAAFRDLVDGDPADKDPNHKPKNGTISALIQVTTSTWAIMKRDDVIPAEKYDPKNPVLAQQMKAAVEEAKLNAKMQEVYDDLLRNAKIDNKLTGTTNTMAKGEDPEAIPGGDAEVKLMSNPDAQIPRSEARAVEPGTRRANTPPPGVGSGDLKDAAKLKRD